MYTRDFVFISLLLCAVNRGATVQATISGVSLMGKLCPGTVDLKCEGVDLTLLEWRYISRNSQTASSLTTFTSTDSASAKPVNLLSVNRAFISSQLTSVMTNVEDARFANFTSTLTIDVSELNMQRNIIEIQCGDPVYFATEEIDFTIIEESTPETPVITAVHATYNDSELKTISVFWQKLVNVQCESLLHYKVALLKTSGNQSVTETVSQLDCTETCSTTFTLSGSNSSETYQLILSASNSAGISFSTFPNPVVEGQSSEYVTLALTFMDCVSMVNCTSNVGGNCSLQYMATRSNSKSDSGQLEITNGALQLQPDTQYIFTATVVSDILMISQVVSFVAVPGPSQLSPSLNAQISVGVLLVVLSLVLLCVMSRFIFKLYRASTSANQMWRVASILSVSVIMILVPVCIALWISVVAIVGPEDDTCNPNWQESRDAVIACSLMFSCLVLAASCFVIGTTCKASATIATQDHRQNEQIDNNSENTQGQKTWMEKICCLCQFKNSGGVLPSYDHLDYNNPSQMVSDHQGGTSDPETRGRARKPTIGAKPLQGYDEAYPLETELKSDSSQPQTILNRSQTEETDKRLQRDTNSQPVVVNSGEGSEIDNYSYVLESYLEMTLSPSHAMNNEDPGTELCESFTVNNICYKKCRQWTAPELSIAAVSYLKKTKSTISCACDSEHCDGHDEES